MSTAEERQRLKELKDWYDQGVIDDEEYKREKYNILHGNDKSNKGLTFNQYVSGQHSHDYAANYISVMYHPHNYEQQAKESQPEIIVAKSKYTLQERLQELEKLHTFKLINDTEYKQAKEKIMTNFSNPSMTGVVPLTWDEFLNKTVVEVKFIVFIISRNTKETEFDPIFQQREVHKKAIIEDTPNRTRWHLFQGKKSPLVVIHTQTDDQISQIFSTITTLEKQLTNLNHKTICCDFTKTSSYYSLAKWFSEHNLPKPALLAANSLETGIPGIFSILDSFNYSTNKWDDFVKTTYQQQWDSLIVVMCQHDKTNFDVSKFDEIVASAGAHKVLTIPEQAFKSLQWNLYSWMACNHTWAIIVIHGTSLSDLVEVSNQWPTRELTLFYNFSEKWGQKQLHIPQSIFTWKCANKILDHIQQQVNNPDLSGFLHGLPPGSHCEVKIDNNQTNSFFGQTEFSFFNGAHIDAVVCANLIHGLGFLFAMLYKFPSQKIVEPVQVTIIYKDPINMTETLQKNLINLDLKFINQENNSRVKCETTFSTFLNFFILHQKAKQAHTDLKLCNSTVADIIPPMTTSPMDVEYATASQTKRALLIGINRYPNLDQRHWLDGCLADVARFKEVLTSKFGFLEKNITTLTSPGRDETNPTASRILAAFDNLITDTKPGDVVVIQYCGHGSRILTPSGYCESIVPSDATNHTGDIEDKMIKDKLKFLTAKGPSSITLVFDSCHSGSITRDRLGLKARRLPPYGKRVGNWQPSDDDFRAYLPAKTLSPTDDGQTSSPRLRRWMSNNREVDYTLLAGCHDSESTYEFQVPGLSEATMHGAFTWFLCDLLLKHNGPVSNLALIQYANTKLLECGITDQKPELLGKQSLKVFSSDPAFVEDRTPVKRYSKGSTSVEVGIGAVHGVTLDSKWSIHNEEGKQIAVGEIKKLAATTATITIPKASDEITTNCYVTLLELSEKGFVLPIYWDVPVSLQSAPEVLALKNHIGSSPLFCNTDSPSLPNAVTIALVEKREKVTNDILAQLGPLTSHHWALVNSAGLVRTKPVDISKYSTIVEQLSTIARAYLLSKLEVVNKGLKVELKFFKGQGQLPTQQILEYNEGECFDFELVNHGLVDVHLAVVEITEVDSVRLITGNQTIAIASGVSFKYSDFMGVARGDPKMQLRIDENFLSLLKALPSYDSHRPATEMLKFFVTETPADYSFFNNFGSRATRGAERHPLSDYLELIGAGTGPRLMPMRDFTDKWAILEQTIIVKPKESRRDYLLRSPFASDTLDKDTMAVYQAGLLNRRGDVYKFLAPVGPEITALFLKGKKEPPSDSSINIIFIHGIFGGEESTWTSDKFWPLWLLEDLSIPVNIYTLRHKGTHGNLSIEHIAAECRDELLQHEIHTRPTIYVCHSLGGIVAKKVLCLNEKLREKAIGVAFYGTPHDGSILANWLIRFSMFKWRNATMEDLKEHCASLIMIQHQFEALCVVKPNFQVISFIETKPIAPGVLVVKPSSASLVSGIRVTTPHDHISICKPRDKQDMSYTQLLGYIRTAVTNLT